MQDPLRVLRAIRFATRFGFILDEQLKEAACKNVKDALSTKVSRERIGVEIDLMISGNQPVQAMTYICDLKLFPVVFNLELSEGCDRDCVTYLDWIWKLIQLVEENSFTDEQRRLPFYASMLLPLRSSVDYILTNSLKRKVSDAKAVVNLHKALEKLLILLPHIIPNGDIELAEVDLGKEYDHVPRTPKESTLRVLTEILLRETDRDFWRVALLMSTLLYPADILNKNFKPEDRKALFVEAEEALDKYGMTHYPMERRS